MALILVPIVAPEIKLTLTPAFGMAILANAAIVYYLTRANVKRVFEEP